MIIDLKLIKYHDIIKIVRFSLYGIIGIITLTGLLAMILQTNAEKYFEQLFAMQIVSYALLAVCFISALIMTCINIQMKYSLERYKSDENVYRLIPTQKDLTANIRLSVITLCIIAFVAAVL